MKGKRVQIIGPITGDPDYRYKFGLAEAVLAGRGCKVFNPAKLPEGKDYEWYMRRCLSSLEDQDAICCLAGWEDSPGARREYVQAMELGLEVFHAKPIQILDIQRSM